MKRDNKSGVIAPLQRIFIAIGLITIFSSVYLYLFLNLPDMLWWGYENRGIIYNLYGSVLLICAVIPFILTLTRIKTRIWVIAWIAGVLISTIATIVLIYTDFSI